MYSQTILFFVYALYQTDTIPLSNLNINRSTDFMLLKIARYIIRQKRENQKCLQSSPPPAFSFLRLKVVCKQPVCQ